MKNLGSVQKYILRYSLGGKDRSGTWSPGCGWVYGNDSRTERIMESLAKRGLVDVKTIGLSGGRLIREFSLNDAGRAAIHDHC